MSSSDPACVAALDRTLHRAMGEDVAAAEAQPAYGPTAPDFLLEAADTIGQRAAERDRAEGERSMRRAVRIFNELRAGTCVNGSGALTERDGWLFMACLKLARMQGGKYRRDDYVDGAAYIALAGECAETKTRIPF